MRIQQTNHARRVRRQGVGIVQMLILFPVIVAFCALAVDVGRLQLARTECQTVADAAARYAARGMANSSSPLFTARANAAAVVAESKVDGSAPTLNTSDVVRGSFNTSTGVFTPSDTGDAVRVTIKQNLARPGAAPLFMRILSSQSDAVVSATAVARYVVTTVEIQPPASGNLWLSGMPLNTTTQNFRPDNSTVWDNSGTAGNPKQRPLELQLSTVNLQPGDTISLEGISGTASWVTNGTNNNADGDTTYIVANGHAPANSLPNTSSNGLSNTRAPIGAVMAVFLSDSAPNTSPAPQNLDFGTAAQRDYSSISPKLKQVFYVGDGKRANGEPQTIVVPPGATRVFFGMMDAWQWNDNTGNFKARLYSETSTYLVK